MSGDHQLSIEDVLDAEPWPCECCGSRPQLDRPAEKLCAECIEADCTSWAYCELRPL